jgi:type III secretion system FlhB-like substrate exporter
MTILRQEVTSLKEAAAFLELEKAKNQAPTVVVSSDGFTSECSVEETKNKEAPK